MIAIHPFLASGALQFAFEKATTEGKITIGVLIGVSLLSWTVIISKIRQLAVARKGSKKFFAEFNESRDPLTLDRAGKSFDGSPAYSLYVEAAKELNYHLTQHPVREGGQKKIARASFETVKVALESAAIAESMRLEKGMIVLSTAVAGGPFIGLLGTVWGVMETFAGIAKANSASLTAMAPGVAGALIATVIGLLVAIPAMFAYNFMVTTIRSITQEMDVFASRLANQVEHSYVVDGGLSAHDPADAANEPALA